jgi:hypothetical protein
MLLFGTGLLGVGGGADEIQEVRFLSTPVSKVEKPPPGGSSILTISP